MPIVKPPPPSSPSCYGTFAFWVLLLDTSDLTSRVHSTILVTVLFGMLLNCTRSSLRSNTYSETVQAF